jgi:hypothetical protein
MNKSLEIIHTRPYFLQMNLRSLNLQFCIVLYLSMVRKSQSKFVSTIMFLTAMKVESLKDIKENPNHSFFFLFTSSKKLSFQCVSNYFGFFYLNDEFTK